MRRGVVAEERQAQAALALEGAVAGAGVAAHAAEQAHDVALEIDFLYRSAAGQTHLGANGAGGESEYRNGKKGGPEAGQADGLHPTILSVMRFLVVVRQGTNRQVGRQATKRRARFNLYCTPSKVESIAPRM